MVNAATFAAVRDRGERCVFWSIQPEGQRAAPAAHQVDHVLARAHPGAIVDLHDAEGTRRAPERLVAALPGMLEGLTRQGYEMATVHIAIRHHPGDSTVAVLSVVVSHTRARPSRLPETR